MKTAYRKIVGRIGDVETGEYYFCDYIFKDGGYCCDGLAVLLR